MWNEKPRFPEQENANNVSAASDFLSPTQQSWVKYEIFLCQSLQHGPVAKLLNELTAHVYSFLSYSLTVAGGQYFKIITEVKGSNQQYKLAIKWLQSEDDLFTSYLAQW